MDALIDSLRALIKQSTEALGPDDPSTLMLRQQLAAALEGQQKSARKVFWLRTAQPGADTDEMKG